MNHEFIDFITKRQPGVLGYATSVVAGTSTYTLIKSITGNLIMPIVAFLIGKKQWEDFTFGPVHIGELLTTVVEWVIMIAVLYYFIKYVNQIVDSQKKPEPEAWNTTNTDAQFKQT